MQVVLAMEKGKSRHCFTRNTKQIFEMVAYCVEFSALKRSALPTWAFFSRRFFCNNKKSMLQTVLKGVCIGVVLILSLILCLLPTIFAKVFFNFFLTFFKFGKKCTKAQTCLPQIFKLLIAFSGGILLAAAVMHLIPESAESITVSLKELTGNTANSEDIPLAWYIEFPWSNMLSGLGIIVFYSLDQTVTMIAQSKRARCCSKIVTIISEGVTWFSLSAHSLVLGFAFGVETEDTKIWILFGAIMAHHFFESLALGFLLQKKFDKQIFVLLFFAVTFACSIPSGIGLGMLLSSIANAIVQLILGITLSFASGALIYVSLFEILQEHEHAVPSEEEVSLTIENEGKRAPKQVTTVMKSVCFMMGYAFMSALAAIE